MSGAWPALGRLLILAVALQAWAPGARAGEMIVQGQVVDVVHMGTSASDGSECHPPKPGPEADLVTLLAWDLRTDCPAAGRAEMASAYRVYYRWDGRTYSRVMSEPPGDTVSLRVRVR